MFCKIEMDWSKVFTEIAVLTLGQIYDADHSSELAYKTRERTRWRKAVKWMTGHAMVAHITLFVMLISPALDAMTFIFEGEDDLNAIDFVHGDTNPAARAIHRYLGLLYNQDDPFWLPWVAHTRFDDEGILLALTVGFSLVGGLLMRSVLPFRMYPWRFDNATTIRLAEVSCHHTQLLGRNISLQKWHIYTNEIFGEGKLIVIDM